MPLPKSLTQPLRKGNLIVGSGWRAYLAPFNQQLAVSQNSTSQGPTIYDLMSTGRFVDGTNGPPAGWIDLGLVSDFKFTPDEKIGAVKTGYRGVSRAKYRAEVAETASFRFQEMTHLAMKIATGSQIFNILKTTALAQTSGPMSASGTPAIAMGASGYIAGGIPSTAAAGLPVLLVAAGSGSNFPAGSFVVCDQDYDGSSFGFVGDAGANVFQGAVSDVDFIRKTSDYVACVKQVVPTIVSGQDGLILVNKFVGGGNALTGTPNTAPTAGAKVQAIQGFASRAGGTYIAEWSGIFTLDTEDQAQLLFYYPHLSPNAFQGFDPVNLEGAQALRQYPMMASFDALGFDDPLDGETVTSYRAYYPPPGVAISA